MSRALLEPIFARLAVGEAVVAPPGIAHSAIQCAAHRFAERGRPGFHIFTVTIAAPLEGRRCLIERLPDRGYLPPPQYAALRRARRRFRKIEAIEAAARRRPLAASETAWLERTCRHG